MIKTAITFGVDVPIAPTKRLPSSAVSQLTMPTKNRRPPFTLRIPESTWAPIVRYVGFCAITCGEFAELRFATHTLWNRRIEEIRPLILWGLGGVFFEAF
jgi:hypothetical protein